MFSKLLKHDWKATSGLLGILSLCALGAGVLGIFVIRGMAYIASLEYYSDDTTAAVLGTTGLGSIMTFLCLGLVAYVLAVQFITIFRFYKSRFTDEGYLTFTLPVNSHQIFLSSFLNILTWLVISVLVVLLAVVMMVVATVWGESGDGGTTEDILVREPGYGLYVFLTITSVITAVIHHIVMIMTSITMGATLAKKHKILASIGIYYGISTVVSVITAVISVFPYMQTVYAVLFGAEYYAYLNSTMTLTILLQLAFIVGGYFLSTGMMKNKLNLP